MRVSSLQVVHCALERISLSDPQSPAGAKEDSNKRAELKTACFCDP
jgi:hypothetical protein